MQLPSRKEHPEPDSIIGTIITLHIHITLRLFVDTNHIKSYVFVVQQVKTPAMWLFHISAGLPYLICSSSPCLLSSIIFPLSGTRMLSASVTVLSQ